MKKKALLVLVAVLAHASLFAQNSPVIKDLLVTPVIQTDTITGLPLETDGELLSVNFKMEPIQTGQTVIILVGTSQDNGDIITWQNSITQNGDSFFVMSNGENREISGNSIEIMLSLTETEYENFVYLSLYTEDTSGQISETLYFEK
jgi:hypothetical protein